MCLAVPMEIVSVKTASVATAAIDGVEREVDTSLVDLPVVGEYVIVHAGFAIAKLDAAEAEARLTLFGELAQRYVAAQGGAE